MSEDLKMLVDADWLRAKAEADPDTDCEVTPSPNNLGREAIARTLFERGRGAHDATSWETCGDEMQAWLLGHADAILVLSPTEDRSTEREGHMERARDARQAQVAEWCVAAFGGDHAASLPQRGLRHAEEAIEAAQAAGTNPDQIHKLVDYIYAKPPGDMAQEIGGSGLTLLALANAAGISADDAEAAEVARVLSKPLAHFHERNAVKNAAGFDALAYPSHGTSPAGEAQRRDTGLPVLPSFLEAVKDARAALQVVIPDLPRGEYAWKFASAALDGLNAALAGGEG